MEKYYKIKKTFYDVYGLDGKVDYNSTERTIVTEQPNSPNHTFNEGFECDEMFFKGKGYDDSRINEFVEQGLIELISDETKNEE